MSIELMKLDEVTDMVVQDKRIAAADNLAASVASMGYTIADADTRMAANDDLLRIKQGLKAVEDVKRECKGPAREYVAMIDNATAPVKARLEAAVPLIENGMRAWDRAEALRVEAQRREQQRIIDEQRAADAKAAKEAEEAGIEVEEPAPVAQVVVTEKPRVEQSRGGISQTVILRRVQAELEDVKELLNNPQWLYLLSLNAGDAVKEYKLLAQRGQAPEFPGEAGMVIAGIRFTTKETYASKGV